MTTNAQFLVNRSDFSKTQISESELPELQDGQVLLKVDEFAFTANNITYAAMGDFLQYWKFFPAPEGEGIIPVWGFADVVESKCPGIEAGERFYGYYPMASHMVAEPTDVSPSSFTDAMEHRKPLPIIYNQYIRSANDPLYTKDSEALQMLFRPLFTTSFLLDDFFEDNNFFNADNIVLTSASSKTALGMAYALRANREERDSNYQVIGLTSAGNKTFVEALGIYDQVICYDQIDSINNESASAIVDFAGNRKLIAQLHNHLAPQLQYSCQVGASHWDQVGADAGAIAAPEPIMFFAPTQAEKRIKEWGSNVFQTKLAKLWLNFTGFIQNQIAVERHSGAEATNTIYQETLAGNASPKAGHIISMK